jgi:hypothetical protein
LNTGLVRKLDGKPNINSQAIAAVNRQKSVKKHDLRNRN